jgi:transcriptional regulator with XRE-family HTH domain
MSAGIAIKRLREERGLTLEELAPDIGISVSQLSRIENGKREPKLADILRIARRLGVNLSDIIQVSARRASDEEWLIQFVRRLSPEERNRARVMLEAAFPSPDRAARKTGTRS